MPYKICVLLGRKIKFSLVYSGPEFNFKKNNMSCVQQLMYLLMLLVVSCKSTFFTDI